MRVLLERHGTRPDTAFPGGAEIVSGWSPPHLGVNPRPRRPTASSTTAGASKSRTSTLRNRRADFPTGMSQAIGSIGSVQRGSTYPVQFRLAPRGGLEPNRWRPGGGTSRPNSSAPGPCPRPPSLREQQTDIRVKLCEASQGLSIREVARCQVLCWRDAIQYAYSRALIRRSHPSHASGDLESPTCAVWFAIPVEPVPHTMGPLRGSIGTCFYLVQIENTTYVVLHTSPGGTNQRTDSVGHSIPKLVQSTASHVAVRIYMLQGCDHTS